ncbi:arginase family protein [Microbacterium sediminis]|uniref:Arginase n=1 Tax=Microbacterium sediminis TaxID=904291 RepID=A0A1B9N7Y5_9MICO|nr:arginase family protein [Microbacterium sediminis]OCG72700.1 arginase [Microbacterium sediminis]QBR74786.1 arginase family protein [Microbacterium sediminis]
MARFVVVPQWQGSPSARAMSLVDGAEAIAGDLPASACHRVAVPLEAGEQLETRVRRASSLMRVREAIAAAVAEDPSPAIVIGGDCSISVPAIDAVAGDDLAVVWLDAHGDLHSPDTSPSGAFAGMALRAVLGECAAGLALEPGRVTPDRVVLAGARDLEPEESAHVADAGIAHLTANDVEERAEALADAVAATGAGRVYIHVDLDVLDPAHLAGVAMSTPFGITPLGLLASIGALRSRVQLAGSTIAGFAPQNPAAAVDDMGTILRLVSALA